MKEEIFVKRDKNKIHTVELNEVEINILKEALKYSSQTLWKESCPSCKQIKKNLLKRLTELDDEIIFRLLKEATIHERSKEIKD